MTSITLFTMVAVLAGAVGLGLFATGRRRNVRSARWVGLMWLAYAIYEVAVQVATPDANIRVDLLLFYPVLLIGLAWAVVALARRGKAGAPVP